MKIKTGDKVVILAGKNRGVESTVTAANPIRETVVVEGVNIAKRHTKATSEEQPGGIIEKEMPLHVSNVAVISPKDGKATKVGIRMNGETKERFCKRTDALIPEVSK